MQPLELADKPLFRGLASEDLQRVAPLVAPAAFGVGDLVFNQGEPARSVYFVEQGEVALRLFPEDGGCLTIAVIGCGGVFGWSAVLGRPRYTSAAQCTDETQVLTLHGSEFRTLVRTEPRLGRLLLGRLVLALGGRVGGGRPAATAHLARVIQAELVHALP
jgi:CRP-like cAMP-binding protein